jgi:hypothetical protein
VVNILLKFFIYFLGVVKDCIRRLEKKKFRSLALGGCLCATIFCEKEGEEHERKWYLSLCNGKWLKFYGF